MTYQSSPVTGRKIAVSLLQITMALRPEMDPTEAKGY
jgi:hypothetical protein